ncbi:NADH-quinone oxidoreductase subunit J [Saccharicrinis sp. FJH2]|uniref:NADH-quinone oxidoreductase subunit J family protein n=1 Tax=unclassified Saccharicrinis TaxID=2646859 RepID=UPI0035D3DDE4
MDLVTIAFYFLAALTLGFSAIVVLSKNIMYSAFALLFTLFGVAGLYVLLTADFLAITQLMLYIGGILVLIIFGVVLTSRITGIDVKSGTLGKLQVVAAGVLAVVIAGSLIYMAISTDWHTAPSEEVNSTVTQIGNELLTNYLLAFEAASMLLLLAIVGAALIARKKK